MPGKMAGLRPLLALAAVSLFVAAVAAGCSETTRPQPSVIERMKGETPQIPMPAGFFGADEGLLKPGNDQQAALVYLNPDAQWNKYDQVILEPIEFWDGAHSSVSADDQRVLTSYFYNALKQDLQKKNFVLVKQPGPKAMVLKIALVNASAATPGLRSVSVVIPQIRLINGLQSLATGSYAFVGSAEVAGKITDSQSGQLLAEALDQRYGGTALSEAAQWKWGDAEHIMNLWAEKVAERLAQWKSGGTLPKGKG